MADEQKVIATIKQLMPAVVSIAISKHLEDVEREAPHELYSFMPGQAKGHKKGKLKLPSFLADKNGMVDVGGGSGFIIDESGLVLTNKHVISDPKAAYTVILNSGRKLPAVVVTRDPINDIAILRIEETGLPIIPLADHPHLDLGQNVIAIGNALGMFRNTVSVGIVSGLSRAVIAREDPDAAPQEMRGLIQTDAAINPGNSGGPLVNLDGEAVGVNAAIVFGAQNIGFAIPIQTACRDLADLKQFGHIRRPFLGVRYLLIDEHLKDQMNAPVDYGALIINESPHDPAVAPGSPADVAGLKLGDIILTINGYRVDLEHSVEEYLDELAVGDYIDVAFMRNRMPKNAKIRLTERM
jgi:serine protease Do